MKQILLIAIGLLLISCQPQNSKSDSKEGISQNRLSRIDTMLEQAILDNKIPGAVAFLSRNGQTLLEALELVWCQKNNGIELVVAIEAVSKTNPM